MMVLLHMQHPCCHVVMETAREHATRCHVSAAAPAVRKRREQAANSAGAPEMPVSVANSSLWEGCQAAEVQPGYLLLATRKGTGALLQPEPNSNS